MNLTPGEEKAFTDFVKRFREDALPKIEGSYCTLSLVPGDDFDVKFAVELGASIMLDKPIIALCTGKRTCPPGLRRVAHAVVEITADIDTEAGRAEMTEKLKPILDDLMPTR